ncbi:hypothetical protein MTO96_023737 [Rhipicephalus appendiculatus]
MEAFFLSSKSHCRHATVALPSLPQEREKIAGPLVGETAASPSVGFHGYRLLLPPADGEVCGTGRPFAPVVHVLRGDHGNQVVEARRQEDGDGAEREETPLEEAVAERFFAVEAVAGL